ncbi:hypothetical protein FQR65_LT18224 [Abscondita terminalis]|nr:hypothetical protein FQR65_LT18224 [Abscondita terminalis]
MGMYAVIEFDESYGGSVAAVHTNWFTPLKRNLFWPPYKDQQRFDRALRHGEAVDENSWTLYKVQRIFHTTDDLAKARRKLKEAELTSNIDSEADIDDDNIRRKRKHIRARKLYDDTSDEADETLPRPPIVKRPKINSQSETGQGNCIDVRSLVQINERLHSPSRISSNHNRSSTFTNSTPSCNSHVTDTLIALVSKVKEQNDQILAWISSQSNVSKTNITFGVPEIPFSLPLQNDQELNQFDTYIRNNNDIFVALVSYLATLGGNTLTSSTNRIFKYLMSDSIAVQFNYYGQRSNKRAFSDLMVKNLIVDAAKKSNPNSSDKQVEDIIKVWLKHAQERLKKNKNAR